MRDTPTDRQHVVLAWVADFMHRVGCPPTLREIGDGLSIRSTNGVNDHVKALEAKGYFERRSPAPGATTRPTRAIKITAKGREYLEHRDPDLADHPPPPAKPDLSAPVDARPVAWICPTTPDDARARGDVMSPMNEADALSNVFATPANEGLPAPRIVYDMPEADYHADRSAWSCSALCKWLTDRRDFVAWLAGELVDAPTEEMIFGRYKHAAIFEGMDVARERFVVAPERGGGGKDAGMLVDRRTKPGKAAWDAFIATLGGREWVRPDLAANVPAMLAALAAHHEAGPLLFPPSDGRNEVSIWWTDAATGARLRCRLDRLVWLDGVPHVPDLKTTEDASDRAVEKTTARFAYHMKCAMYLDAVEAAFGVRGVMPLVFVETSARPRVNVKWTAHTDRPCDKPTEIGRAAYRRIIREIQACQAAGDFREPWERTTRCPLTLPAWMMREHEFSASDDLEGAENA